MALLTPRVIGQLHHWQLEGGELLNAVTFVVFGAAILGPALDELTWRLGLYAVLAFGLLTGWPPLLLWAMTIPAVAMSAFLGYSLIVNGHQCRICWTSHVANAMLFLLLAARAFA